MSPEIINEQITLIGMAVLLKVLGEMKRLLLVGMELLLMMLLI